MIKQYLQLVRISGIFTAFSNILLGFFLVSEPVPNFSYLIPLLSTSGFLFMGGMVLNDYFDYDTDKKERPHRPLPSNSISRKSALYLGLSFLIFANASAAFVGIQTLIISLIMTILIISYDFGLKKIDALGIIVLSMIRILNVILGTSIEPFNSQILYFTIPIGIYVAGISILAKTETSSFHTKTKIVNFAFILITFGYVLALILNEFNSISIILLGLLTTSIFGSYLLNKENTPIAIQKKVTFQLLGIILLDATLVSIVSDIIVTLIIVSLYVPAYLITKKMYFT